MGLFNSNRYTKEGKGVSKDEVLQKRRFFYFFELLFRKFWSLILSNLVYILGLLPVFAFAFFWGFAYDFVAEQTGALQIILLIVAILLSLFCLSFFGPASAAFTYQLRNYGREEHVFIWSDFWQKFKENYKSGSIVGILDILLCFGLGYSLIYHLTSDNIIFIVAGVASAVLVLFMNFYLFQLLITIEAKWYQYIKNAFLFAFIGLKHNFFSLFWIALISVIIYFCPITVVLIALLVVLILPALYGFIITFNSYVPIKKHIIDPYNEKKSVMSDDEEEDPIFSDDLSIHK